MNIDNPPNHHVYLEIGDIERGDPEEDPLLDHGPLRSRPGDLGSPEEDHSSCSTTDENHLHHLANDLARLSESYIAGQESLETQKKLNTRLLTALDDVCTFEAAFNAFTVILLNEGANPNATCHDGKLSACHLAALAGGDALSLLIANNAEKFRVDDLGRTPLHMAALDSKVRNIALLLDFPEGA